MPLGAAHRQQGVRAEPRRAHGRPRREAADFLRGDFSSRQRRVSGELARNPGKWSQRLKHAVPWWFHFDPYMSHNQNPGR